jgi:hypothetical protein
MLINAILYIEGKKVSRAELYINPYSDMGGEK